MQKRVGSWVLACVVVGSVALVAQAQEDARERVTVPDREQALAPGCASDPWKTTVWGDVVISTQAQASAHACTRYIFGSLTIADSDELAIELPSLQSVLGDVRIVYSSDNATVPPDEREIRKVSLPVLRRIVGNLSLQYPGANGGFYGAAIDFGLNALTDMRGDVTVTIDNFGADVSGLRSLTRLVGSLTVALRDGDLAGLPFLDKLRLVTGDVTFDQGHNTFALLNALDTVRGSLRVNGMLFVVGGPDNLISLRVIGQNLEFRDVTLAEASSGARLFASLRSVGGFVDLRALRISPAISEVHPFNIGSAELRTFGLRLIDTEFTAFAGASPQLARFGRIILRDNLLLCESEAQAFVDAQRRAGFLGLADRGGNGRSASCP